MPRKSSGARNVARSLAHGDVAEHGDHQAAALADAVDGADDRLQRPAHGVEGDVVHAEQVGQVGPAVVVRRRGRRRG